MAGGDRFYSGKLVKSLKIKFAYEICIDKVLTKNNA